MGSEVGMQNMTVPYETDDRVRIPREWAEELGFEREVQLERTASGVLVKPAPEAEAVPSWEEIFASKLEIGSGLNDEKEDLEPSGDDYSF
jgi:hypothetical protein